MVIRPPGLVLAKTPAYPARAQGLGAWSSEAKRGRAVEYKDVSRHIKRREPFATCAAVADTELLDVVPKEYADEIEEPAAQTMLRQLQSVEISLPDYSVHSTFVGPVEGSPKQEGVSPVLLLHGFDGSCIGEQEEPDLQSTELPQRLCKETIMSAEYRRMKPFLDPHVPCWSIDLLGNGFCVPDLKGRPDAPLGPVQRRQHLQALWKQQIRRPVTLVGTSLGGAVAIDFALAHPEAVDRLLLLAPQVMTDGIGPMSSLPTFAAKLGVKVLQSFWLRSTAGKMAYYDKQRFANDDAVRVGRIHTFVPGWLDATVAFMKSGGYRVSKQVAQVQQDTTIVWGAQDEILGAEGGRAFAEALPHARLVVVEDCGHSIHLEKPQEAANIVLEALGVTRQPRRIAAVQKG